MLTRVAAFLAGKSTGDWSEDAISFNGPRGRAAVADGVSNDSMLTGLFSQFSGDRFVSDDGPESAGIFTGPNPDANFPAWYERLQADWNTHCQPFLIDETLQKEWRQFGRYARSTLVGVKLSRDGASDGTMALDLLIVGDSGVVVLDRGKAGVITQRPAQPRGPRTQALCVNARGAAPCTPLVKRVPISSSARILLMTDAMLDWSLARLEPSGEAKVLEDTLCALRTQSDFYAWHRSQRRSRLLKDDDASLLIVTPTASPTTAVRPEMPATPGVTLQSAGAGDEPHGLRADLTRLIDETKWRPVRRVRFDKDGVELEFEPISPRDYHRAAKGRGGRRRWWFW